MDDESCTKTGQQQIQTHSNKCQPKQLAEPVTQVSNNSIKAIAQRALIDGINDSPRMLAQRWQIEGYIDSGLQHTTVHAYLNHPAQLIQTKLTIGQSADKYEQEADRVAAKVVEQINAPVSAKSTQEQMVQRESIPIEGLQTKPILQHREAIGGGEASTHLESAINSAKSGGQALDAGLQQSMGKTIGADFRGVRVHTDARADQLNQSIQAKAFTTGQDVFFRKGAYQPGSHGGQELIAHELTHVVQQHSDVAKWHTKADHASLQGMRPSSFIQRKGVKAEMEKAKGKFEDFKTEAKDIDDLRDDVSSAIYNAYKPNPNDPTQHYSTKQGRDKTKQTITEASALSKARRLNHWTETATVSAMRIYEELIAARDYVEEEGMDLADVSMGIDTSVEPDVTVANTTALEVKRIDSEAQGAVDSHVAKGSAQLDKRKTNKETKDKYNGWVLRLRIGKTANPWPFTPTALSKLTKNGNKPTKANLENAAKKRINDHSKALKVTIKYEVVSDNPNVETFSVGGCK